MHQQKNFVILPGKYAFVPVNYRKPGYKCDLSKGENPLGEPLGKPTGLDRRSGSGKAPGVVLRMFELSTKEAIRFVEGSIGEVGRLLSPIPLEVKVFQKTLPELTQTFFQILFVQKATGRSFDKTNKAVGEQGSFS
ncbi:MAG: hypothetical protein K9M51_03870 [Candidatus Gracilibacteria bacterium]|nr:hypothetical protein [Candidatus Gracilibacteria bacterium]